MNRMDLYPFVCDGEPRDRRGEGYQESGKASTYRDLLRKHSYYLGVSAYLPKKNSKKNSLLANGYDYATPLWLVVVVIIVDDAIVLVFLFSTMLIYHHPHPRHLLHLHLLTHQLL